MMMIDARSLTESGRSLERAFALIDRASEIHFPSTPEVVTKRALLDEARRQIALAEAALRN